MRTLAGAVSVLLAFSAAPTRAAAGPIVIDHQEVSCVVAGKFPRFAARFDPADKLARARLHFRPEGWPHWYSVPMKREGYSFWGVLPKPEKKLQRMNYYLSAVGEGFEESRTAEYTPSVVSGPGGCARDKILAIALSKAAQVIVAGPAGVLNAPLVPLGFSAEGVIAGGAAGAASAGGGATAATGGGASAGGAAAAGATAGGGIGATTLVLGGVALVGAGAAVAGSSGGGGGSSPTTTRPPGPPATTVPPATTPPPTTAPPVPCPACYAGVWEFRATTVACGTLCGACSPGQAFVAPLTVNADGTFRVPETSCEPPGTIDAAGNVNFVLAGDTCPGSPPGLTCPAGTGAGRCSDTRTCAGTAEQGGDQITWAMTKQ